MAGLLPGGGTLLCVLLAVQTLVLGVTARPPIPPGGAGPHGDAHPDAAAREGPEEEGVGRGGEAEWLDAIGGRLESLADAYDEIASLLRQVSPSRGPTADLMTSGSRLRALAKLSLLRAGGQGAQGKRGGNGRRADSPPNDDDAEIGYWSKAMRYG